MRKLIDKINRSKWLNPILWSDNDWDKIGVILIFIMGGIFFIIAAWIQKQLILLGG